MDGSMVDSFYAPSSPFSDGGAGFTMNPLSPHPPRTPRTSVIKNTTSVYTTPIYPEKPAAADAAVEEEEEEEEDVEDERAKARAARVRRGEVWREMLLTSRGRDKAFKVMQYSLKVYLLFHTSLAAASLMRKPQSGTWDHELLRRFESTVSGLSLTRKCLLLFEWLSPLNSILAQHTASHTSASALIGTTASTRRVSSSGAPSSSIPKKRVASKLLLHSFLHAPPPVLLDLVHAASDDVATVSKLGLIGVKTGMRAARFADWCWFISTLVNLVENAVERNMILAQQNQVESRQYDESMAGTTAKSIPTRKFEEKELSRLQEKDYWLQVTRTKLLLDLIFVSYDVFKLERGKRPVQAVSGLAAGILSCLKLYTSHKAQVVKKRGI